MMELFIIHVDGSTKESFTNSQSVFIRNIRQFKDKESHIDTNLFAIIEGVDV